MAHLRLTATRSTAIGLLGAIVGGDSGGPPASSSSSASDSVVEWMRSVLAPSDVAFSALVDNQKHDHTQKKGLDLSSHFS